MCDWTPSLRQSAQQQQVSESYKIFKIAIQYKHKIVSWMPATDAKYTEINGRHTGIRDQIYLGEQNH